MMTIDVSVGEEKLRAWISTANKEAGRKVELDVDCAACGMCTSVGGAGLRCEGEDDLSEWWRIFNSLRGLEPRRRG